MIIIKEINGSRVVRKIYLYFWITIEHEDCDETTDQDNRDEKGNIFIKNWYGAICD